jgi:hypothetical protein
MKTQLESLIARTTEEFRSLNYSPLRSEIRAACQAAYAVNPAVTEYHVRDLLIAEIEARKTAEDLHLRSLRGVNHGEMS